jgi:hypothetical protein
MLERVDIERMLLPQVEGEQTLDDCPGELLG